MRKIMFSTMSSILLILSGMALFSYTSDSKAKTQNDRPIALIIKAPFNSKNQYTFAGEVMPMNEDTKERLDKELTINAYRHSHMIQNIKLSNKYFPIMEEILAQEGVPTDFKYLAVAESNLVNATSPAGAKGIWQIRSLAAKEMGLKITSQIDERYDIDKATRAAAKYLYSLKKRFGTWSNACAAYNMGPTAFLRSQKRQSSDNYFDLNLSDETNRYVFRLFAIKEIMDNSEKYGFIIPQEERYAPLSNYYEVNVDSSISSLGAFAKTYDVSYRNLKRYNPWIIEDNLKLSKENLIIRIPKNQY